MAALALIYHGDNEIPRPLRAGTPALPGACPYISPAGSRPHTIGYDGAWVHDRPYMELKPIVILAALACGAPRGAQINVLGCRGGPPWPHWP